MKTVFYIDPQSGNNLAMYDYELLSRIHNTNLIYIGNVDYNYKKLANCKREFIFRYSKYKSKILKLISYIRSLIILIYYLFKYKPQVVHIQWFRIPKLEYYYYKLSKKIFGFNIVYTVHNILPHVVKKGDNDLYSKIYIKLADRLIVHTESSKKELSDIYGISFRKIGVAPHGPLQYAFSNSDVSEEILRLKSIYGLNSKVIVSILGYQSTYKGSDIIIQAWEESPRLNSDENICLLIAGKFRDIKIPTKKYKNLICIPKKLTDIEFNAFLRMSDLLIFPYRVIEQSGLLLSAICEHIPYCATNVGELLMPLKLANVGWEIKDNTPSGVSMLLDSVLSDVDKLKSIKNRNADWKRITDYYDWNNSAEMTEKIYNEF